jgi:hypothetical protein
MLNVRVTPQAVVTSTDVTFVLATVQSSVATVSAATPATVGRLAGLGLQPKVPPGADAVITGAFVSTVQVYTAVAGVQVFPHSSVAEIVNVRVIAQVVPPSTCETLTLCTVQASVATTNAATPASVGSVTGLQPKTKFVPLGTETSTGAVLSIVQVYTTVTGWQVFPHSSVAVMLNVRVVPQDVVTSAHVTLMLATVQLSVAVTCFCTLATVGKVAGLQPKLPPGGYAVIVGAVLSIVQVYTAVFVSELFPHSSVTQMLKVRVTPQAVVTSTDVTFVAATVQSSVATVSAATLASVGRLAGLGLQPKVPPGADAVITGAFVSSVQVYTTVAGVQVFPHSSVAEIVKVRVMAQAVPPSTCETLTLCTVQVSVAPTNAATPASVGSVTGLQPKTKFVPLGTETSTGAVLSTVQVYTTVTGWQVFPHSSVAVMLKVRVVPHAVVTSA